MISVSRENMKTFLIFFVSLLLLPLVQAAPIDVSLYPSGAEVRSGDFIVFNFTIRNNLPYNEDFIISIHGERPWWRTGYLLVGIANGSQKTVFEEFFPVGAKEGDYNFTISVKSFRDPTINTSQHLLVKILPFIAVTSFNSSKDGNEVLVRMGVNAGRNIPLDTVLEILDPSGKVIKAVPLQEKVSGVKILEKTIPFELSPPGTYSVRTTVEGKTYTSSFLMENVETVAKRTQKTATLLYDEISIVARNTGNVPTTFEVDQAYPRGTAITGLVTAPTDVSSAPNEEKYTYQLVLQPGEEGEIRYRVERGPIFLGLFIGVLAIASLGLFTAGKYHKPVISKKYRRGKNTTSIVLGVRNSFTHSKNVLVRDWVSPLAYVATEDFEALRPVVRKSDAGTELIWSLGDMRPREERMVSYKIKPLVQGSLKMSKASMKYKTRKGETKRVLSNSVLVK